MLDWTPSIEFMSRFPERFVWGWSGVDTPIPLLNRTLQVLNRTREVLNQTHDDEDDDHDHD